jgi:hypothetical protein
MQGISGATDPNGPDPGIELLGWQFVLQAMDTLLPIGNNHGLRAPCYYFKDGFAGGKFYSCKAYLSTSTREKSANFMLDFCF